MSLFTISWCILLLFFSLSCCCWLIEVSCWLKKSSSCILILFLFLPDSDQMLMCMTLKQAMRWSINNDNRVVNLHWWSYIMPWSNTSGLFSHEMGSAKIIIILFLSKIPVIVSLLDFCNLFVGRDRVTFLLLPLMMGCHEEKLLMMIMSSS